MFVNHPAGAKICLISDVRTLADANADVRYRKEPGADSVHGFWRPGLLAFGKLNWQRDVARVALFEFGEDVTPGDRKKAKSDLIKYLKQHKFRDIIVLGNRSKSAQKVYHDEYAEAKHTDTVCWDVLKPPASLRDMGGTFWQTKYGRVLGLENPQNVDYVYGAVVQRWLAAVRDNVETFVPPKATTVSEPGPRMLHGLNAILQSVLKGELLALDIESHSGLELITVLGLSDGTHTVAVPWQSFIPHGQAYTERGLEHATEGQVAKRIIASAKQIAVHNGIRFDFPFLARHGVHARPDVDILDTYFMSGVLYNQFRHGLQQCVSYEFVTPPWKTMHGAGKDKDDPESWIQNPQELREYNCQDSFYQWYLTKALLTYMGKRK